MRWWRGVLSAFAPSSNSATSSARTTCTTTFAISELLGHDAHDLIHKAVGGWLREAGRKDLERLRGFLDRCAPEMPRIRLRYATEGLEKDDRERYRSL